MGTKPIITDQELKTRLENVHGESRKEKQHNAGK